MFQKRTEKLTGMDRRNFIRGSSLLAMAAGLNLVKPLAGLAQEQSQRQERASQQNQQAAESQKAQRGDQADETRQAEQTQPAAQEGRRTSASGEREYLDAAGEWYRVCPECGGNMYKSGRTWTCEICGYSYTE